MVVAQSTAGPFWRGTAVAHGRAVDGEYIPRGVPGRRWVARLVVTLDVGYRALEFLQCTTKPRIMEMVLIGYRGPSIVPEGRGVNLTLI